MLGPRDPYNRTLLGSEMPLPTLRTPKSCFFQDIPEALGFPPVEQGEKSGQETPDATETSGKAVGIFRGVARCLCRVRKKKCWGALCWPCSDSCKSKKFRLKDCAKISEKISTPLVNVCMDTETQTGFWEHWPAKKARTRIGFAQVAAVIIKKAGLPPGAMVTWNSLA